MSQHLVIMDHDGGIDDYLSAALLLTMEHVDVLGIVVTPADCHIEPAASATCKLLDLMGRSDVPVAKSTVRGLNPFPHMFRRDAFMVDRLPILNAPPVRLASPASESGQNLLVRLLREAPGPVTLLVTSPLTTVAAVLDLAPDIEAKIKQIVWMGGALQVPGNVDADMEGGQGFLAEWNVYWDPVGAARVGQTGIPILMCPLDLTNKAPVTAEFVSRLGRQRQHPLSDLASQCYGYALIAHQGYFLWDVLTTAYLGQPDWFEVREWETEIVTEGVHQGQTRVVPGGRRIRALAGVAMGRFYDYVAEQWAR